MIKLSHDLPKLWDLGEIFLQMPFDNLKHVKQGGLLT